MIRPKVGPKLIIYHCFIFSSESEKRSIAYYNLNPTIGGTNIFLLYCMVLFFQYRSSSLSVFVL